LWSDSWRRSEAAASWRARWPPDGALAALGGGRRRREWLQGGTLVRARARPAAGQAGPWWVASRPSGSASLRRWLSLPASVAVWHHPLGPLAGVVSGGVCLLAMCRLLAGGVAARVVASFLAISLQQFAAGADKCHGFAVAAMVVTRFPRGKPSWLGVEPLCLAISFRGRCFRLCWCAPW
jgi:hypothetical protein